MKRVLIIAEAFPPRMGSGVERNVGYAKYLPRLGWTPFILTKLPPPDSPVAGSGDVRAILPSDQVIVTHSLDIKGAFKRLFLRATRRKIPTTKEEAARARFREERLGGALWSFACKFIFVPDPDIGWFPFAVRAGITAIRSKRINAIVSSSAPETSHLIGLALSRVTGVPWIADFRDPWTQNPYVDMRKEKAFSGAIDRGLERRVLKRAAAVVSVSEPIVRDFARLAVRDLERKLHVITNGFDPDDFAGLSHRPPDKLTITYTGILMGRHRSIAPLLDAVRDLVDSGQIPRDRISIKILETYPRDTGSVVRASGLSDIATVKTGVPHREAVREQVAASVLLLIVRNDPEGVGIYTGKLFEYLGARRPILALVPPNGVAAALIGEAKAGTVVDSRNHEHLKGVILRYYREHEQTGTNAYEGDKAVASRYERPVLAGQLAELLNITTCKSIRGQGGQPR